jgi:hypothetical protein
VSEYDGGSSTIENIVFSLSNNYSMLAVSECLFVMRRLHTSANLRRGSIQSASVFHRQLLGILGSSLESGILRTRSEWNIRSSWR